MKMIRWFGKWLFTSLLICLVTVMTTWYMVNAYVDSLLKYLDIDPNQLRMPMTQVLGQVSDDWSALHTEGSSDPVGGERDKLQEGSDHSDPGSSSINEEPEEQEVDGEVEEDEEEIPPAGAVPVMGQVSESGESGIAGEEVIISQDEFNQTKDEISNADKIKIFMIAQQLPQDTMQELSLYMENGLTQEELLAIQDMMEEHLTPEQYEQLMEIMQKY